MSGRYSPAMRPIIIVAVLAVTLAGCVGSMVAPPAANGPASTASGATTALPSDATPQPLPTPSLHQMGEAYLVIASAANRSLDRHRSHLYPNTVKGWHDACLELSLIEEQFINDLAALKFTPAIQPLADELIAKEKAFLDIVRKCTKIKTLSALKSNDAKASTADKTRLKAAVKLRLALGLSTAPLY